MQLGIFHGLLYPCCDEFAPLLYHYLQYHTVALTLRVSASNSGEGIPDLLLLLVQWTQKTMIEKLTYSNEIQVCPPFHSLEFLRKRMQVCGINCLDIFFVSVRFWRLRLLKAMGPPLTWS